MSYDKIAQIDVRQCLAMLTALSVALVRSTNEQADEQFGQESRIVPLLLVGWHRSLYFIFFDTSEGITILRDFFLLLTVY